MVTLSFVDLGDVKSDFEMVAAVVPAVLWSFPVVHVDSLFLAVGPTDGAAVIASVFMVFFSVTIVAGSLVDVVESLLTLLGSVLLLTGDAVTSLIAVVLVTVPLVIVVV